MIKISLKILVIMKSKGIADCDDDDHDDDYGNENGDIVSDDEDSIYDIIYG